MPSSSSRLARVLLWGLVGLALVLPLALLVRDAVHPGGVAAARPDDVDYGIVPDFALIERSGRPLRREDLAARPWVASFIFTRCQGVCPVISRKMAELHGKIGDRARLVSFSVDPRNDTPEVLRGYASALGASEGGWLFATGSRDDLRRLVSEGFRLSLAEAPADGGESAITHSDRVALVDRDFRIVRYYRGTEDGWIDELLHDLDALPPS